MGMIHTGDCLEWLRGLPSGIAHCCVTSPPYYGLRDYGGDKSLEIGTEQTPEEYIARLVEVFREMRRVLRADGLLWLNLGDSYSVGKKWANGNNPVPCTVIEPFAGSGTTLQVAQWMGRRWLGCELNAKYVQLIEQRIATKPRCMLTKRERQAKRAARRLAEVQGELWG